MSLGVPAVSTAVMGTRDIVGPGRGALPVAEHTPEFAAACARILLDPALRARLACAIDRLSAVRAEAASKGVLTGRSALAAETDRMIRCHMLRPILLLFALLVPQLTHAQHVTRCDDLLPRDHVRDHDRAADVLRDARRLHRRERLLLHIVDITHVDVTTTRARRDGHAVRDVGDEDGRLEREVVARIAARERVGDADGDGAARSAHA